MRSIAVLLIAIAMLTVECLGTSMDGLIARWPLDAANGVNDISGNGYHLTLGSGSELLADDGPCGTGCMYIPATASSRPRTPVLPLASASTLTVSFWTKIAVGYSDWGMMFESGDNYNNIKGGISCGVGGTFNAAVYNSSYTAGSASEISINDGVWHHVAAVFRKADNRQIQYYVDGRLVPSALQYKVGTRSITFASTYMTFGVRSGTPGFDCSVADVCVFSRELSREEVTAQMNESYCAMPVSQSEERAAFSNVNEEVVGWALLSKTQTAEWRQEVRGFGNYGTTTGGVDQLAVLWSRGLQPPRQLVHLDFDDGTVTNTAGGLVFSAGSGCTIANGHLSFSGSGASGSGLASDAALNLESFSAVTFSYWIKNVNHLGGYSIMETSENYNNHIWALASSYDGNGLFSIGTQNTHYTVGQGTAPFSDNDDDWHQVVVSISAESLPGAVEVYVDGRRLEVSYPYSANPSSAVFYNGRLFIGGRNKVNDKAFDIDEINLYGYRLSSNEVAAAYARELPLVAGAQPPVITNDLTIVQGGKVGSIFDYFPFSRYGGIDGLKPDERVSFSFPEKFMLEGEKSSAKLKSWRVLMLVDGVWTESASGSSREIEFTYTGVPVRFEVKIISANGMMLIVR